MISNEFQINDLLPHRPPMLLVSDIISVDEYKAVTAAKAKASWPLCDQDSIDPLVLIELVAQTAGIHNGWVRERREGPDVDKRGWIVGIKRAVLPGDDIVPGTTLITRSQNRFEFEGFREIIGTVEIRGAVVAEITLQLLRFGKNQEQGPK